MEDKLCLLEVLTALEVPEVMRCALPCMLEAAEGGLRLLGALEVLEAMCRVLLCTLEAVEGECLLEVMEVMCRVCSVCWRRWRSGLRLLEVLRGDGRDGEVVDVTERW